MKPVTKKLLILSTFSISASLFMGRLGTNQKNRPQLPSAKMRMKKLPSLDKQSSQDEVKRIRPSQKIQGEKALRTLSKKMPKSIKKRKLSNAQRILKKKSQSPKVDYSDLGLSKQEVKKLETYMKELEKTDRDFKKVKRETASFTRAKRPKKIRRHINLEDKSSPLHTEFPDEELLDQEDW